MLAAAARRRVPAVAAGALAGGVTLAARVQGAYHVGAWALLGLALLAALLFLVASGRLGCPSATLAGAAALAAGGALAVVSVAWGGLPHEAWLLADRGAVAAAALLLGGALATHRRAVGAGVLAAAAAIALEILVRAGTASLPAEWIRDRQLEGPVGYSNGQALFCAAALPLALWAGSGRRAAVRAVGGGTAVALVAVVLLTQSRAGVAAAAVAIAVQLAVARRWRAALLGVAVAAAVGALVVPLRAVDHALADGIATDGALRTYAAAAAVAAGAVAVLAAAPAWRAAPRSAMRIAATAAAAVLVVSAGAAAATAPGIADGIRRYTAKLATDETPHPAPGATRYATLTLDGRRDAWRVASRALLAAPLTGDGAGRFAVRWGVDRRLPGLYILQPHSIELELGAELGIPGIALFAVFLAAAALALRRGARVDRGFAAAAAAAFAGLLLEASLDWTWSFPGLVAPVLLLVGAASPATPPRRALLLVPVLAAAVVALALPYAAAAALARGSAATAVALDPWDANAIAAEARALEAQGALAAAAARYGDAAAVSRRPWLDWFDAAGALRRAGADGPAAAACVEAHNADPLEDGLREGPCGWPWLGDHYPSAHPPGRH